MQIIKPRAIGLLHKCYLWQQQRFAVAGLLFFPLGQEQPKPLPEFEQWGACSSQLPAGSVLDMGFAKARGEVLLSARGYPPAFRLAPARALVRVGKLEKQIRLPRGAAAAAPLQELLPLDVMDRQRQRYNGTYDRQWLQQVHPGLPADTDARFFQSAPGDQQLAHGFFQPGTAYCLKHLHPQLAQIDGCVPALRMRAFVEQQVNKDSAASVHELAMQLETLWFFPEVLLGVALYRGQFACSDSDALDVKRLLLALEHAADAPRPAASYEEQLQLRSDPQRALPLLFNEAPLLPQRSEAELAARQALITAAEAAQAAAVAERRDSITAQLQQDLARKLPPSFPGQQQLQQGLAAAQQDPAPSAADLAAALPVVPAQLLQDWDFDLGPLLEATTRIEQQLQQQTDQRQQELQALAASWQQRYAGQAAAALESDEAVMQRCNTQVFVVAQDLVAPAQVQPAVLQMLADLPLPQLQELQQQGHMNGAALQEALALKARAGRQGRQSAPEPLLQVALSAAQHGMVRELVQQCLTSGGQLAGRDLAGADLSGMDFSGCDLRDVMFECANLNGCRFTGARLDGAVFTAAQLDGADFTAASLQQANFSKATGTAVCFRDAQLSSALLPGAVLPNCDFSGVQATRLLAQGADLRGSRFVGATVQDALLGDTDLSDSCWDEASLQASVLMNATLDGSRWQRATLTRCIAVGVQGAQADFAQAKLDSVQFSNTGSLQGASFDGAYCRNVGFRGLDLVGLRAGAAVFKDCDFCDTQLQGADFSRSLLSGCLLMQLAAPEAVCEETLFSTSILRKADFSRSNFDRAEFNQCTLAELNFDKSSQRRLRRRPLPTL